MRDRGFGELGWLPTEEVESYSISPLLGDPTPLLPFSLFLEANDKNRMPKKTIAMIAMPIRMFVTMMVRCIDSILASYHPPHYNFRGPGASRWFVATEGTEDTESVGIVVSILNEPDI